MSNRIKWFGYDIWYPTLDTTDLSCEHQVWYTMNIWEFNKFTENKLKKLKKHTTSSCVCVFVCSTFGLPVEPLV